MSARAPASRWSPPFRALTVWGVVALSLFRAAPLLGQSDTARVSYRTTDVVFLSAGRAEGVHVGDTVTIAGPTGAVLSSAVVLSTALHSASARLLTPDAPVAVGQVVRFAAHPPSAADSLAAAAPAVQALAPPPDTALPPVSDSAGLADTAQAMPAPLPQAPAPRRLANTARRWSGGVTVNQLASSAGGVSALTSYQTVGSLVLAAPLADGVELRTRITSRWRGGAAATTTGLRGAFTIPYELQLRLGRPGAAWNASVGRFVPTEAIGLGWLDGVRLETRVAAAQRLGLVAGFVPDVERLRFSTETKRAGAYWAFGGAGDLSGSFSAAADFSGGSRRRTLLANQTYWQVSPAVWVSASTEVDVGGAAWQGFRGLRLTNGWLNVRADLPYGFRGSLGVESHRSIVLWESVVRGDTAPLPGRLNGVSASLGRDVAGWRVDLSGGLLERATDATPTVRAMLTVARRSLFVTATGQHGDLFDYGALMVRLLLPYRALPFNASLGAGASFTRSAGGALTQWRYSLQPELSKELGGGVFLSLGGDLGAYAGRTSVYLHGGLSYRFH